MRTWSNKQQSDICYTLEEFNPRTFKSPSKGVIRKPKEKEIELKAMLKQRTRGN
jgi:hypothetical protein